MTPKPLTRTVLVVGVVLLMYTAVLAGPPLICHPFNIGDAKSLPFRGPSWSQIDSSYDSKNLVADTMSLLNGDTPVLVRMETLRRATLYARNDAKLAAELFDRVHERTKGINAERRDRAAQLAWFDLGYLAETYRQAAVISKVGESFWKFSQAEPGIDGYALVKKAIERGGGAEMEFAAAVIASDKRDGRMNEHLRNAMAGAKPGTLLATNLASHFPDAMKTASLKK